MPVVPRSSRPALLVGALAGALAAALASGVVALAAAAPVSGRGDREHAAAPPTPLADFLLESSDGARVGLWSERPGRVATTLLFLDERCPASKAYGATIGRLAQEYGPRGVAFLAIDATAGCDAAHARAFAESTRLGLPLLLDPLGVVARRLGVTRAATAIVVDAAFLPIYRGAIDDQHSATASRPRAAREYVVEALDGLLAGEDPSVEESEGSGVALAAATTSEVNWNEHVAPIVERQCIDCHRPGQVGPMELLDYDDAKGWAPQIAEVVAGARMPPWHADARYGHFVNERRLTDTEKATLARWAASGAKEGPAAKRPKAPEFHDDGWAMGEPDLVVQLPEPQPIPAEGVVDYRYIVVDPQLDHDVWVQVAEIRPTATASTHHILAFYVPPGSDPRSALRGIRDGSILAAGFFAAMVPGCRPNVYPDGMGKKIEKGAKFVFQCHYTTNGKTAQDQARMGLRFCKEPPQHEVLTRGVFSFRLRIPANDAHAVNTAEWTFKKPTKLLEMFPHMHTRGAAFKFERVSGSGADEKRTVICDVPKYDFNWQNFYLAADPIPFAAGDRIFCTAVFDNSKENPFNPDPSRAVTWGEQTFEEMMIGYIDYVEEG